MKKPFIIALIAVCVVVSAAAKKDSGSERAILTIDKTPTTVGEFEYLYNKNNSQQAVRQTPEEYMELFKVYKLKVADAIACGLDTTQSFRNEYFNYRNDLASPYFLDRGKLDKEIMRIYGLLDKEVEVSHIMFPLGQNPKEDAEILARADSVRNAIIAGEADFDDMAVKFSVDMLARRKGNGSMGFVRMDNKYPFPFVNMAFLTPVGEISKPVNSGFGWHLILPKQVRKAPKSVLVEHILKLTQGKSEAEAASQKAAIDSIYNILTTDKNADFGQIAKAESDDPGSARNGGKLDWFSTGVMVPEFEQASMELGIGEISKPVKTSYGYHIIHKINERDTLPYEQARALAEDLVNGSDFVSKLRQERFDSLREKYNEQVDEKIFDTLAAEVDAAGDDYDKLIGSLRGDSRPVATYTGGKVTVGDVVSLLPTNAKLKGNIFAIQMRATFESRCSDNKLRELEVERLTAENPEFRNLAREYHDGILLYEISNRNVWEKASTDKKGLEDYFRRNRAKYAKTWDAPRFKGYIVFATSDSVSAGAKEYLEKNSIPADSSVIALRKIYNKEIRVERVIAPKGKNEIVDYIAFGGPRPQSAGKWIAFFPYQYEIISEPQEAMDIRGDVTSDYQNELEKKWVDSLYKKHKVKVNKSLLKNIPDRKD